MRALILLDALPDPFRKLARRQFGRVDLLDDQPLGVDHRLQVDAEALGAFEQQSELLVEDEHSSVFAALDRAGDEREREQRLACAGRPEDEHARPTLDAAAQQGVQLGRLARQHLAPERPAMLGRYEPREHPHAAGVDDEIVIAAAIALAAIFDHPQPPPLRAIFGRQFLEPDHAVGDAVHGAVVGLARQIIQHQHGAPAAREIMFEREDLAAISKR